MAVCGNCNSSRTVCSCVFAPDGSTTTVVGNGSVMNPIGFNKAGGPTPRPLANVARFRSDAAVTVPINTQTVIPFTLNQLIKGGVSLDSGMVNLTTSPTRITCVVPGKYLVGGYLLMNPLTAVAANNRVDVYLSEGVPAGANVWASESQLRIAQASVEADNVLGPVALVQWAAGNYMEMYVFSTIADATENPPAGGAIYMYAIWMDD